MARTSSADKHVTCWTQADKHICSDGVCVRSSRHAHKTQIASIQHERVSTFSATQMDDHSSALIGAIDRRATADVSEMTPYS